MDGYIGTRTIVVRRLQADRCAEAAARRLAAGRGRDERAQGRAERLLIVVFLAVLATAGLAGTGFRLEPGLLPDPGVAPAAGLDA